MTADLRFTTNLVANGGAKSFWRYTVYSIPLLTRIIPFLKDVENHLLAQHYSYCLIILDDILFVGRLDSFLLFDIASPYDTNFLQRLTELPRRFYTVPALHVFCIALLPQSTSARLVLTIETARKRLDRSFTRQLDSLRIHRFGSI